MRTIRPLLLLLTFLNLLQPGALWAGENLRIGVAPHSSARIVMTQYQPLRTALQTALGLQCEVSTARDFTDFARRSLALDYDLVITTAHQATLLRDDAGFIPLLTYQADFEALAVTAVDSGASAVGHLQGRAILGLNQASLVTLWGLDWLRRHRVKPGSIDFITASDSVADLLLRGEATAGFMSLANHQKLAPQIRNRLAVIDSSGPIPGRVYLLSPKHTGKEASVRKALADFAASDIGQRYFADNGLLGYRAIRKPELDAMRPYAESVRQQLRSSQ